MKKGGVILKVAGIICEYNPFHNGHMYQIEETRKVATHIVCAMSGNFVQRGDFAIADKWTRAKAAVLCGADLVVEIPTPWACASAENFAKGGLSILSSLGIDILSFGCENSNGDFLKRAAQTVDLPEVGALIKSKMSGGFTYPAALRSAVCETCGEETAKVFDAPNNTLAVEYIRQSKKLNLSVEYLPIKRIGAQHFDESVTGTDISSAAALRKEELAGKIERYIPREMFNELSLLEKQGLYPYKIENAQRVLLSSLRRMSVEEMVECVCDENGLAQRLYKASRCADSFETLIQSVKVRSVTLAAVRRAVISCFLKIPSSFSTSLPPYVKVLAMNRNGADIIKNSASELPIITRYSQVASLPNFGKSVYSLECSCTDLYSMFSKKISDCSREQTSPIFVNS